MTWHRGPFWAFDTETTGIDVEHDRVVTACLIQIQPGQAPVVTSWLVAVDIDIPQGAQDVHGVTTEHARAYGRPATEVLPEIVSWLHTAREHDVPLVGFNLAYDLSLVAHEARRWGAPDLEPGLILDGLVLDRYVDKWRKGKRTLTRAAEVYNVELAGAHDAGADAIASARVVWRIATNFPQVGDKTVAELQPVQAQVYRDHAISLEKHFKKKARAEKKPDAEVDAIHVETEWPIRRPVSTTTEEAA